MSAKSNDDFITRFREYKQEHLLKISVVYTTGPEAIRQAITPNLILTKTEIDENISAYALKKYNLNSHFYSANTMSLHANQIEVNATLSSEIGEIGDQSWLMKGKLRMQEKEIKMEKATQTIQRFFRHQIKKSYSNNSSDEKKMNKK